MRRLAAVLIALVLALAPLPVQAASGTYAPQPIWTGLDSNGNPVAGGLLFIYNSGTSTKATTWSDVAMTTPNADPLVLDSAGRATIVLNPGSSYKFVLAPAGDTDPPTSPIATRDGVMAVTPTGTGNDSDVSGVAGTTLLAGQVAYLSDGSGGTTAGRWYLGDADFTYASVAAYAIGLVVADTSTGATGTFRVSGRMDNLPGGALTAGTLYNISATAGGLSTAAPANTRPVLVADGTHSGIISPWTLGQYAASGLPGLVSQGAQTISGVKTFAAPPSFGGAATFVPGQGPSAAGMMSGQLTASADSTTHANSGAGETTLSSYVLPQASLDVNGKAIRISAYGTFAANGNTKTIKVKFGATVLTVHAAATNAGGWVAQALVIRTSSTTQKCIGWVVTGTTQTGSYSTGAETLNGNVTITTTGQGTSSSDIVQEVFFVETIG